MLARPNGVVAPYASAPQKYAPRETGGMGVGWSNGPTEEGKSWSDTVRSMFGPATAPRTMSWQDSQAMAQRLFPDAYRGSNGYMLSHVLEALSNEASRGILNVLGEIVVWEGFNRVVVEEHTYNKTQFDQVPELGVSRTQTQQFRSWSASTKRFAHSFRAEATWFKTAKGQEDYLYQMSNITLALTDLMCLNAIYTALTAPINVSRESAQWFARGFSTVAESIEEALDSETTTWGILSQAGDAENTLRVLFTAVRNRLSKQGRSGHANLLLPEGCKQMVEILPPGYATFDKSGQRGWELGNAGNYLTSEASRAGFSLHEVGKFFLEAGKPDGCPLVFDRTVGLHTIFDEKRCGFTPTDPAVVGSGIIPDLVIADFQQDFPAQLEYRRMLIASGVFDHSGKMVPKFASAFFEHHATLQSWADQYFMHNKRGPAGVIPGAAAPNEALDILQAGRARVEEKMGGGGVDIIDNYEKDFLKEGANSKFAQKARPHVESISRNLSGLFGERVPADVVRILKRAITNLLYASVQKNRPVTNDADCFRQIPAALNPEFDPFEDQIIDSVTGQLRVVCEVMSEITKEEDPQGKRWKMWSDAIRVIGDPRLVLVHPHNENRPVSLRFAEYLLTNQGDLNENVVARIVRALSLVSTLATTANRGIPQTVYDEFKVANNTIVDYDNAIIALERMLPGGRPGAAAGVMNKRIETVTLNEFIAAMKAGTIPFVPLLVMRPHVTFSMGSALALVPGSLMSFIGEADFQLSSEVTQKTVEGNLTVYTNAFTKDPNGIVHVPNIVVNGYRFGGSTKAWDPHDREHVSAYSNRDNLQFRDESIFVIPLFPNERPSAVRWINMSPTQVDTNALGPGIYTPRLMSLYAEHWNFKPTNRVGPNGYFSNVSFNNVFTCNEWSAFVSAAGGNLKEFKPSPAWFDWRFYPGARRDLCGQGKQRLNRNYPVSDMVGSIQPVDIFEQRSSSQTYYNAVSF